MSQIDLRCCSCSELLDDLEAAGTRAPLVMADPAWNYSAGVPGNGKVQDHYETQSVEDMALVVSRSAGIAADDAYLAVWCTMPYLEQWCVAFHQVRVQRAAIMTRPPTWEHLSGAVWDKSIDGKPGIGYHFRGQAEPLLLYRVGNPRPKQGPPPGIFKAARLGHSEKPQVALQRMVQMATDPGDLVVDLYAGETGSLARACMAINRRYVGAEIDPDRHRKALARISQGDLFTGHAH